MRFPIAETSRYIPHIGTMSLYVSEGCPATALHNPHRQVMLIGVFHQPSVLDHPDQTYIPTYASNLRVN